LSFAHNGRPHARLASTTSAVAAAEWANMRRRSSTLGHDTFTSTATTPSGAPERIVATFSYASTVNPQMLATTRAPVASSGGSSSSSHASAPAFCNPTLLIIPASLSYTRGAAFPAHASADTDFVTTAPSEERSIYRANSAPCPAHPDAVRTGLAREREPTCASRSTFRFFSLLFMTGSEDGGRRVPAGGVGRGDGQRDGASPPPQQPSHSGRRS